MQQLCFYAKQVKSVHILRSICLHEGQPIDKTSCKPNVVEIGSWGYTYTPVSMHSLFSDLFSEIWRAILGGVRDYVEELWEVSRG